MSGDGNDGYAALDNFKYDILSAEECQTKPKLAEPNACQEGEFTCSSDHSCIPDVSNNIFIPW